MSIYTDMIAEIEKRGACADGLVNDEGRVCLIGAYAYAKGMDPTVKGFDMNWPYKLANVELVHLKDIIVALEPRLDEFFQASAVLWRWNDRVAKGDKEKMIALLKLADKE